MALARARLARVRTRSQPFIGLPPPPSPGVPAARCEGDDRHERQHNYAIVAVLGPFTGGLGGATAHGNRPFPQASARIMPRKSRRRQDGGLAVALPPPPSPGVPGAYGEGRGCPYVQLSPMIPLNNQHVSHHAEVAGHVQIQALHPLRLSRRADLRWGGLGKLAFALFSQANCPPPLVALVQLLSGFLHASHLPSERHA